MIAAQRDTSVSALVKRFLLVLASGESETERLKRQERGGSCAWMPRTLFRSHWATARRSRGC